MTTPASPVALTDRINPIVVKELRQGLRARLFWICFTLLLIACLVIALFSFVQAQASPLGTVGRGAFYAFFSCLALVQFFLIPYTAYRSLAREREDDTWVLLTLTGLGARRVLRGKLTSFLLQSVLYGSAVVPFLLFSYYLNGIDLPTILVVLVLSGLYQLFLTAMAVSAAVLAEQRVMRGLVHFLLIGVLLFSSTTGLTMAIAAVENGVAFWKSESDLLALVSSLWGMLSYAFLLFESAAARLSLHAESYARGVRVAFLVQLVGSAALFLQGWSISGFAVTNSVVPQITFCLHLTLVGVFLVTDVDGVHRRLREKVRFYSLLQPGALRGYRLVMLCLVVSTAFWMVVRARSTGGAVFDVSGRTIPAAGLYAALFLSLPLLVSRLMPPGWPRSPAGSRVLFLIIAFVASVFPPLASSLITGQADDPLINLFQPFVGVANFDDGKVGRMAARVVAAVTLAVVIGTDVVLARRDRPLEKGG